MTQRTDGRGRELSPVDQEALERAIELVRNRSEKEDPGRRAQIDRMMEEDDWFRTVEFCVHCCQMDLVRPRLWQPIPADIDDLEGTLAKGDDGLGGGYRAALLLKRMLAAGLSRYEPDPVRALEAKRRQRTATEPGPTAA
jgi:hypothetical protein